MLLCFLFPESKWHRIHPRELQQGSTVSSTADEKDDLDSKETKLAQIETAQRDPFLGKGAPSKQQFKLWQPLDHHYSLLVDLLTPWKLLAYPIVQFASFVVSWSASAFLTANLTQDQAFAAPPYNKGSQTIGTQALLPPRLWKGYPGFNAVHKLTQKLGFYNWAIFIGALIGLFTAGPLSDWISMRFTKKNGGIREPEMRLAAMIPYVIIMILGNVIVAVGYQDHWSWKVSFLFCLGPPLLQREHKIHSSFIYIHMYSLDTLYSRSSSLSATPALASKSPRSQPSPQPTPLTRTNPSPDLSSCPSPSTKTCGVMALAGSSPRGLFGLGTSNPS